jgi:hypothetical protein
LTCFSVTHNHRLIIHPQPLQAPSPSTHPEARFHYSTIKACYSKVNPVFHFQSKKESYLTSTIPFTLNTMDDQHPRLPSKECGGRKYRPSWLPDLSPDSPTPVPESYHKPNILWDLSQDWKFDEASTQSNQSTPSTLRPQATEYVPTGLRNQDSYFPFLPPAESLHTRSLTNTTGEATAMNTEPRSAVSSSSAPQDASPGASSSRPTIVSSQSSLNLLTILQCHLSSLGTSSQEQISTHLHLPGEPAQPLATQQ